MVRYDTLQYGTVQYGAITIYVLQAISATKTSLK